MDTDVVVVSVMTLVLLGFLLIGGPMFLADCVRARRQAVIARQIALTDALDAEFGALIAPVVRKPFFGPWEVRIAVPLPGSAVLAGVVAVTDAVFADVEGTPASPYRLLLTAEPDSGREVEHSVRRRAKRWTETRVAAA